VALLLEARDRQIARLPPLAKWTYKPVGIFRFQNGELLVVPKAIAINNPTAVTLIAKTPTANTDFCKY